MLKEIQLRISQLECEISQLSREDKTHLLLITQLERTKKDILEEAYKNISAKDRVFLARHPDRPNSVYYINNLFEDFLEFHGDRLHKDDQSIIGGIASYHGIPVTVIAQVKGKNLQENLKYNFGMSSPEGYRKSLRLMRQAEKFDRPIITFIDTPGAYPGLEAEAEGQGEAIARNLMEMSSFTVPIIAIVIGEGGSGGALALGVANTIIMFENSILSVLSPEGFATILWKDAKRSDEACEIMKLTANDLQGYGMVDYIIQEPNGGVSQNPSMVCLELDKLIYSELTKYRAMSKKELAEHRYKKFRTNFASALKGV